MVLLSVKAVLSVWSEMHPGIAFFLMFSFHILTVSFIESERFSNLNEKGRPDPS